MILTITTAQIATAQNTIRELKEVAKQFKIAGYSRMNKATLLEAVQIAQKAALKAADKAQEILTEYVVPALSATYDAATSDAAKGLYSALAEMAWEITKFVAITFWQVAVYCFYGVPKLHAFLQYVYEHEDAVKGSIKVAVCLVIGEIAQSIEDALMVGLTDFEVWAATPYRLLVQEVVKANK